MTSTVTTKNMISIPAEIARRYGIKPGFTFDWKPTLNPDEIHVRVVPDRAALSRRLKGAGKVFRPARDSAGRLVDCGCCLPP